MEILEQIKAKLEEFEARKNALIEELRNDFPAILRPLFESNPVVESISWTQYTPYFNDGDECTFGVNMELDINEKSIYDYDDDGYESMKSIQKQFRTVLEELPDQFYLDLFGDHAQITIYADGRIVVDEYDHD
jgi:hypothetical protein